MGNNWWYNKSIKQRKYLDAQKKKNQMCEFLYAYDTKLNENPGIYILTRQNKPTKDGEIKKYIYIGQAKNVIDRLADHYLRFEQRIDISLKTRGLWYPANPYAWKIQVYYCNENELNEKEREFIKLAQEKGYELYNITSGGQDEGKEDINERAKGKGYRDGLVQGYSNCLKDVKEFFDKYLDYQPKSSPECYKKPKRKNEQPTLKQIYIDKFNEFKELLERKEEN